MAPRWAEAIGGIDAAVEGVTMRRHSELPWDSGQRDPEHTVKLLGLGVPAALVLWAAVNVVTCQAVWPIVRGRELMLVWADDWLRVLMAASVKLGVALACFGWYFMANREEWSYWCELVTLFGGALAAVAFVVGSLSFVW
jgi:hypothetical protein